MSLINLIENSKIIWAIIGGIIFRLVEYSAKKLNYNYLARKQAKKIFNEHICIIVRTADELL